MLQSARLEKSDKIRVEVLTSGDRYHARQNYETPLCRSAYVVGRPDSQGF